MTNSRLVLMALSALVLASVRPACASEFLGTWAVDPHSVTIAAHSYYRQATIMEGKSEEALAQFLASDEFAEQIKPLRSATATIERELREGFTITLSSPGERSSSVPASLSSDGRTLTFGEDDITAFATIDPSGDLMVRVVVGRAPKEVQIEDVRLRRTAVATQANAEQAGTRKQALEAFAVGTSMLQSHIEGATDWNDVLEQAIKRYDKAIRLQSDFVEAHFNKGICYIRGAYKGRSREQRISGATRCFETVLQLKPDLGSALFAIGFAQYNIGAGGIAQGSERWNAAVRPAIATLNKAISKYPRTAAAENASAMLTYIEWQREEGWNATITGRSKTRKPPRPDPVPMQIEGLERLQASVKEAVAEVETGIIFDETVTIFVGHSGPRGEYSKSGKVTNTRGLKLHQFYTRIAPYNAHYDDTFEDLYLTFDYNGRTVAKKTISLPDPGGVIMGARRGTLNTTPQTFLEHENVKISILVINADADPNGPPRYKSIDIRVITETVK